MGFWQFLGNLAVGDNGETIHRVSKETSISSNGIVYTKVGNSTVGSDGSFFTQAGDFNSDGSTRVGNSATGLGAVFNNDRHTKLGSLGDNEEW